MAALLSKEITNRCGVASFSDPKDYESAFGKASVQLTVTGGGDFKTRLTWLRLRHLQVFLWREQLSRIAFVSLPPSRIFVSFPTGKSPLIWNGIELRLGDIVFHGRGEQMHQRTNGKSSWGLMSFPATQLSSYGNSLNGRKLAIPSFGRILRPQRVVSAHLLRLHAEACRLAETNDGSTGHPRIRQGLEQELCHAVVDCISANDNKQDLKNGERHADIMVRFEGAIAIYAERQPSLAELCAAIGVAERTLRVCCAEFLGLSPTRYILLRRLNMARSALRRADPATATVAEIARSFQFSELGRFAVAYRRIFGEMPSITLRKASVELN
jgi:AraC-like DNA-binding protein